MVLATAWVLLYLLYIYIYIPNASWDLEAGPKKSSLIFGQGVNRSVWVGSCRCTSKARRMTVRNQALVDSCFRLDAR